MSIVNKKESKVLDSADSTDTANPIVGQSENDVSRLSSTKYIHDPRKVMCNDVLTRGMVVIYTVRDAFTARRSHDKCAVHHPWCTAAFEQ